MSAYGSAGGGGGGGGGDGWYYHSPVDDNPYGLHHQLPSPQTPAGSSWRRHAIPRKPVRQTSSTSSRYAVSPPSTIHEEITPAPTPAPSHQPAHRGIAFGAAPAGAAAAGGEGGPQGNRGSAPFMHYEDFEYFEPAKEEPDVRVRETDKLSAGVLRGRAAAGLVRLRAAPWPALRSTWLPEVVCCVVSIASLAALAALLRRYDGRGLRDWPLGVTLNTLVAFLAAIAQAALVVPVTEGLAQMKWNWFARQARPLADMQNFEDASRGPYGSVKLLWTTKGRFVRPRLRAEVRD